MDNQRWYALQEKVFYSDRMDQSREAFAASILPLLSYRSLHPDSAWLFATTDTLIRTRGGEDYIRRVKNIPLFSLDGKVYTSIDWFRYLLYRRKGGPSDPYVAYPDALRGYVHFAALEYYQDNLTKYNPDFRYQVHEFSDGTLLFAIMQQEIWSRSAFDSAATRQWFEAHKERFHLQPGADLIAFTSSDSAQLSAFCGKLEGHLDNWRPLLGAYPGVSADQAYMELHALGLDSASTRESMVTRPKPAGNNWHAYAILKVYPSRPAQNFEDVKGLVLGDYQAYLEKEWLAVLKKKYPVSINSIVLKSLTN
jgi:peptidyl-prolyl cis-trans isomerase SurA